MSYWVHGHTVMCENEYVHTCIHENECAYKGSTAKFIASKVTRLFEDIYEHKTPFIIYLKAQ